MHMANYTFSVLCAERTGGKAIYGCYGCIHYMCVCILSEFIYTCTCPHLNLTHSHPHTLTSSPYIPILTSPHTLTLSPSQWRYQLHHNRNWSQLGTTPTPPVLHGGCSKGGEKEETSCRPKYELHPVRGQYRTRILQTKYLFIEYCNVMSITAPQDAHKLVLQVAELLTASLSGIARHELTM